VKAVQCEQSPKAPGRRPGAARNASLAPFVEAVVPDSSIDERLDAGGASQP
jgi:hypothetical protein